MIDISSPSQAASRTTMNFPEYRSRFISFFLLTLLLGTLALVPLPFGVLNMFIGDIVMGLVLFFLLGMALKRMAGGQVAWIAMVSTFVIQLASIYQGLMQGAESEMMLFSVVMIGVATLLYGMGIMMGWLLESTFYKIYPL